MKRIAIIDVSSILHVAKHGIGKNNKLSHKEQYTFVIYGFLFKLRSIALNIKPDVIVFALDSKKSIRKEKIYDDYKANRSTDKKTPEQKLLDDMAYPQFNIVQDEILYDLGFNNVFKAEGYEADDIIGVICKSYNNCQICIVSSDSDMYQLIRDNIVVFHPKHFTYFTVDKFKKTYGIGHPVMWERVKAYGGCSTDNVPGLPIPSDDPTKKVRHIAEKGAINFLKNKIKPHTKTYQAFIVDSNKKILQRNKLLTIIPLQGTPQFKIQEDTNLSRQALIDICEKFGFNSILDTLDDFCTAFKLK